MAGGGGRWKQKCRAAGKLQGGGTGRGRWGRVWRAERGEQQRSNEQKEGQVELRGAGRGDNVGKSGGEEGEESRVGRLVRQAGEQRGCIRWAVRE